MEKNIQCIILSSGNILISEIEESFGDIPGEPDCKLLSPFKVIETNNTQTLEPWLSCTNQTEIMLRSGDALTFVEPNGELRDKYIKLTS